MSVTDQFRLMVGGDPDAVRMDLGCLLIGARARGTSDDAGVVGAGMEALDDLAARCPGATLDDLRRWLFADLGFGGNRRDYDDPANSYLDQVLARRVGLPITLCVMMIEVGRRLGMRLDAVGMPGHFLVGSGAGSYVDPFDSGRMMDVDGCRRRFIELAGPGATWHDELLDPVTPNAVLARVLGNLKHDLIARQDLWALDWVFELRAAIPDVPPGERAERAAVLSALGRFDEAAGELEFLARLEDMAPEPPPMVHHPSGGAAPSAQDTAAELRRRAAKLRARLN